MFIKGVWGGKSEASDEHIVLTLEVVCSRERFGDWSGLVDMIRDFSVK